jgi:hypothetical protein
MEDPDNFIQNKMVKDQENQHKTSFLPSRISSLTNPQFVPQNLLNPN